MSDNGATVIIPRARVAPGTTLNGIYRIDQPIAAGGMGEIYKGFAVRTGKPVAIKMIRSDLAENDSALALFRKEASSLDDLQHEAIVRYYLFEIDPQLNRAYLAMEFVDGVSLKDHLVRGPLSFEDTQFLQQRIASGLHAAHKLGIIHRDVAPDNVILPGGDVSLAKILDFGIARSTKAGEQTIIGSGFAGKFNYVSPEQLGLFGGDVTGKSDIYSLGLLLAECLQGRPIDMNGSQVEVIDKRRVVPDLSKIDPRFRPLLEKMLQPLPEKRPATMAEVAAWLPAAGKPARSASASTGGSKTGMLVAAGLGAVAVLGGGLYFGMGMSKGGGETQVAGLNQSRLASEEAQAAEAARRAADEARTRQSQEREAQARAAAERTRQDQAAAEEAKRVAETRRQEDEARKAAEARAQEEAKRVADARAAEDARKIAEARAAEDARRQAEAKAADDARRLAETRAADDARRQAEAKAAEDARRQTAETKAAEDARKLAEARAADEARRQAEARTAEEARKQAADAKAADDARKLAEARAAEEARKQAAEAKAAEEARRVAEAKAAEDARKQAEAARLAEERRIASEAKAAEEARKLAEARAAEEARKVAAAKAAEERRIAAEAKAAEDARKVAEAKAAEDARKAAAAKAVEERRLAADAKAAEDARKIAEAKAAEEARKQAALQAEQAQREAEAQRARAAQDEEAARQAAALADEAAKQKIEAAAAETRRGSEDAQLTDRQRLALEQAQARWLTEEAEAMRRAGVTPLRPATGDGQGPAPEATSEAPTQMAAVDPRLLAPVVPRAPARPVPTDAKALTLETQQELTRIGCYDGNVNGNLNNGTRDAIKTYRTRIGVAVEPIAITPEQLLDLRERSGDICKSGKAKPPAPAIVRRPQREEPVRRAQQPPRQREAESRPARAAPAAAPAPAPAAAAAPRRAAPGLGLGF
jgi:hypothetical protein